MHYKSCQLLTCFTEARMRLNHRPNASLDDVDVVRRARSGSAAETPIASSLNFFLLNMAVPHVDKRDAAMMLEPTARRRGKGGVWRAAWQESMRIARQRCLCCHRSDGNPMLHTEPACAWHL